jgi:hypothetical protein
LDCNTAILGRKTDSAQELPSVSVNFLEQFTAASLSCVLAAFIAKIVTARKKLYRLTNLKRL